MKILVVCQYYYPEPFRVTDICEELVKLGHQVTVLTGLPNYPEGIVLKEYKAKERRDEVRNGVHVIRCYEHGRGRNVFHLLWNYFSYPLSAKRKIRKLDKDYDVVFINQLSPVMMAWPAISYAKKYKKKTFLYCYDLWPASLAAGGIKKGSLVYRFFQKISKDIYSKVDSICVTSKSFIDYFVKEHGIKGDQIVYLPQYSEDLYGTIDNRPHKGLNFVFAGNIGAMQSVETIIKAASLIKERRKDIAIHIVGDGRDLENCKALAIQLGASNVVFHGRKPTKEMDSYYSMADAMIVSLARDELISKTLPGKVQSYMAAGKPIIAAADGETKMVIEEAKCGYICESENASRLAEIFEFFDPALSQTFSKNARDYYHSHFEKQIFFETLQKELEQLCGDQCNNSLL